MEGGRGAEGRDIRVVKKIIQLRRQVLAHYWKHGRHTLPWRQTRDPYAVLVSEVMLQQTQVDRVIPYFLRWMEKFPTPAKLAHARLADVLKEWSGLGYNRRAKMIHECAKTIVERHGGRVPKDAVALCALPGIGPYTAGAVRVFAFNEADTLLETNVRAVFLYHFFPRRSNVSDSTLAPLMEKAARGQEPSTWHAALMDYGSYLKRTHPNPSRRSAHHVRQSRFEGSSRQIRGRIIRTLLLGPAQTSVLLKDVHASTGISALAALRREGMIIRQGSRWKLAGSSNSR